MGRSASGAALLRYVRRHTHTPPNLAHFQRQASSAYPRALLASNHWDGEFDGGPLLTTCSSPRGGAHRRRRLSAAAEAAPNRTVNEFGNVNHDKQESTRSLLGRNDTEKDCLWLSTTSRSTETEPRHCPTCSCETTRNDDDEHDDSTDNDAASRIDDNSSNPIFPSSHNDAHNQEESATAQPESTTTTTSPTEPLASRLMDMMSRPSATTVLQQPIPAYSVKRRVLPRQLTSLNSPEGRQLLLEAMNAGTAQSYLPLTLHFSNQSDPAFCGITTLLVVLNALSIDPNTRWRGGWRYFGDEESLLARCCLPVDRVQSLGITVDEFHRLASCQGLRVQMKRAVSASQPTSASLESSTASAGSLEDFRRDVVQVVTEKVSAPPGDNAATPTREEVQLLVVSFGRSGLQQTGDGHFSPLGAYHAASDQVLVLDVARFKYPPYWVKIEDLYQAMTLLDTATQLPRGWFVVTKPSTTSSKLTSLQHVGGSTVSDDGDPEQDVLDGEDRRPAHLVPTQKQASWCPMHKVKIDYCQNNPTARPPPTVATAAASARVNVTAAPPSSP